jgi:hypothetical protein
MIEDSGRFRTFQQSSSVDVNDAVASCPVNCMHFMSFDELKEMEVSRDDGDGRSDHRHFGKGKQHTPLHVSRTSNDSNHKSSWYHYLKTKCHGMYFFFDIFTLIPFICLLIYDSLLMIPY